MSDEAHLPAEQSRAQAPARLPQPDGDRRRPQGAGRAPQPRPQEAVGVTSAGVGPATGTIETLKRRADYLAANGGRRVVTPAFILQVRPRGDGDPRIRLGITVSKKVGNSVTRNRLKRRFRALARAVLPESGFEGADHVLIGRAGQVERPFDAMTEELRKALAKAARSDGEPKRDR